MAQSIREKMARLNNFAKDKAAVAFCTSMMLISGSADAQFLDKINNAKAIDSSAMVERAKTGSNNVGMAIQVILITIGLFFVAWGVMWIMQAGRSDGRKEAKPGWIMVMGGGALGGLVGIYALTVGTFAGLTS